MPRHATSSSSRRPSAGQSPPVGTAEFRANLARYLKQARAGRPVIVQERGRDAYVLTRLEDAPAPSVVGPMRERTEYVSGAVVNACESWRAGVIP